MTDPSIAPDEVGAPRDVDLSASPTPRAPKPEPSKLATATLTTLFLLACCAMGVVNVLPRFGVVLFDSNVPMVNQHEAMRRSVGPLSLIGSDLHFVFHAYHHWPERAPDLFTFDWQLVTTAGVRVAEGDAAFDMRGFREDQNDIPNAVVSLEGLQGHFVLIIEPTSLGNHCEIVVQLRRFSVVRPIAEILTMIFGAVFLGVLAVVIRRHRQALAAWRRVQPPPSPPPSEAPTT